MKKTIMMVAAIAMTATMAQAATRSTTADGNWTNAIWNTAPVAIDAVRLNHAVTVDSSVTIFKVFAGYTTAGSLTINSSGSLITTDNVIFGDRSAGTGLIDGGFLGITGALNIGNGGALYPAASGALTISNSGTLTNSGPVAVAKAGTGSLTLNSGSIVSLGNLVLGNFDGTNSLGAATVNLLGGTASFSGVNFKTAADLLNIENNAVLTLLGDDWTVIDAGVAAGNITWANGTGMAGVGLKTWDNGTGSYLHTDFDGTDTTVWVNQTIPEPATLGLVAFAGAALIIRRRFHKS